MFVLPNSQDPSDFYLVVVHLALTCNTVVIFHAATTIIFDELQTSHFKQVTSSPASLQLSSQSTHPAHSNPKMCHFMYLLRVWSRLALHGYAMNLHSGQTVFSLKVPTVVQRRESSWQVA